MIPTGRGDAVPCRAAQGSTSVEQEVEEGLERGERVGTNSRFQQKETGEAGLILTSVSYFRSLQWAVGTRAALVVWPLALGAQGGRTVAWSVRAPQGTWPGLWALRVLVCLGKGHFPFRC